MVTLLVGFPGSGKSYFAVEQIYNLLTDTVPSEIDIIYSNINGLNFDSFPNSAIDFQKLDLDDLYNYLSMLYKIYNASKNLDNVDDELIKFAKERGYFRAFFVFDECHDFFSKDDPIKIFWLTYHRHLFQEILLITQNKTLISSKYRAIPEIFIEAQPRSKKIFSSTLGYKKFSAFAMRKSDFFEKLNIKTKKEVFNLYSSGNMSHQKSIIFKYLKFMLIGLIIVISIFYYMFSNFIKVSNQNKPIVIGSPSNLENKKPISEAPTIKEEKEIIKKPVTIVSSPTISKLPTLETFNNTSFAPVIPDKKVSFIVVCDFDLGCNYKNVNYSYDDFINALDISQAIYKTHTILDTDTSKIYSLNVTVSQSNFNKYLGEI